MELVRRRCGAECRLLMGEAKRADVVQVTNEINRTYVHGSRWIEMTECYMMELGTKCYFYMDGLFGKTYFYYKQCTDSSIYLKDARGVIVHYPPAEPDAEEAGPHV
jgi:hypothetical protein